MPIERKADLSFTGSTGDAKFAIQQLFEKMLRRRRWGRPYSNYMPHLFFIETRKVSDHLRHLENESQIEIRKIRRRIFVGSIAILKTNHGPDIQHRILSPEGAGQTLLQVGPLVGEFPSSTRISDVGCADCTDNARSVVLHPLSIAGPKACRV